MAKKSQLWRTLSEDGQTITLHRFIGRIATPAYATEDWFAKNAALIGTGAVLDVETTGLVQGQDEVIEIGIRKFFYHRESGEVVRVGEGFQSFQEPRGALSEEIQALTGITPEMLRGQVTDWEKVGAFLSPCEVIVAHNAAFDRPFIDEKVALSRKKLWGCSFKHLNWFEKGFPAAKLESLAAYHGFFFDAHRALEDSDVVLNLLSLRDAGTDAPYLRELLACAQIPFTEVLAFGSPFETKDLLKGRGYRWDSQQRVWKKMIRVDAREPELEWLEAMVYNGTFKGTMRDIPLHAQFSAQGDPS